jgi:hypothetical protein
LLTDLMYNIKFRKTQIQMELFHISPKCKFG